MLAYHSRLSSASSSTQWVSTSRLDASRSCSPATTARSRSKAVELKAAEHLSYSSNPEDLRPCQVYIVTVPTPIDNYNRPNLRPIECASELIGQVLKSGDVVVLESTVYPGCTEEVAVPILERVSGLRYNRDFFAGYSPERINPGDKQHRLTTIPKITSGSTPEVADFVDALYTRIVEAGTHKVTSMRVAEAAKVIENTQRHVNIALINELALIFNRLGIDTEDRLSQIWLALPKDHLSQCMLIARIAAVADFTTAALVLRRYTVVASVASR